MSKNIKHVIETKGLTLHEIIESHIKFMEKSLNTGPIIGEGREIIYELCRNLLARDQLIQVKMNWTPEQVTDYLERWADIREKEDKEILEKRKKK